jgi:hypothetical protein
MAESKRHMDVPKERVLERVLRRANAPKREEAKYEVKLCQAKP